MRLDSSTEKPRAITTVAGMYQMNLPGSPPSAMRGEKAITVVTAEATTGLTTCAVPSIAASGPESPRSRQTSVRSATTTAASTIIPSTTTKPPREIMFTVIPRTGISSTAAAREGGDPHAHPEGGTAGEEEEEAHDHQQEPGGAVAHDDGQPVARHEGDVVDDVRLHPVRQVGPAHHLADQAHRVQDVGALALANDQADPGAALGVHADPVVLSAEGDPGHVLHPNPAAVRRVPDDGVGDLLRRGDPPVEDHLPSASAFL